MGIQPEMLDPDPDPDEMNADPQPCLLVRAQMQAQRLLRAKYSRTNVTHQGFRLLSPLLRLLF